MAVRWTVSFRSVSDKSYLVKIYDSSYEGEPVALEPADEPFSLAEGGDSLFMPVSTESGYLRVIDNGDLDGIMPMSSMERRVELYRGSALIWMGYMAPQAYDGTWEPAPSVREMPVVNALSAMESVTIGESASDFTSVAGLLNDALAAVGLTPGNIYLPVQIVAPAFRKVACAELRFRLSRFNFMDANDAEYADDEDWTAMSGRDYLSIMQDICTYFGWTMVQSGNDIIFNTSRNDIWRFVRISGEDLSALAADPDTALQVATLDRNVVLESALTYDGDGHRLSVMPGVRKIVVECDGRNADIGYSMDCDGKELASLDAVHHLSVGDYSTRIRVLDSARCNIELKQYAFAGDGSIEEVPWSAPESGTELAGTNAAIVDSDSWETDDEHKFNYSYSRYLRLSRTITRGGSGWMGSDRLLAVIRSTESGVYPAGGALFLSATVLSSFLKCYRDSTTSYDVYGELPWGPFANNLRMSVRVGSLWWSSFGWLPVRTIFSVECGAEDEYDWYDAPKMPGRITNKKTLQMPYNGGEGFVMPTGEHTLTGDIEIRLYSWVKNTPDVYYDITAVFIGGLKVDYYSDIENVLDKTVRLSRTVGEFGEEKSVKLHLTSNRYSRVSLASLWYQGATLSGPVGYVGNVRMMPEEWLLDSLTRAYSAPARRLELEVEPCDVLRRFDLLRIDGEVYVITGIKREIADEHMTLTLIHY